jgi:hypothetical protein
MMGVAIRICALAPRAHRVALHFRRNILAVYFGLWHAVHAFT